MTKSRADLRAAIQGGIVKLKPILEALADKATPTALDTGTKAKAPTLILSVDQAEELFLAEAQDEAQAFLALLRDLLNADAPATIAIFTIRSDNYERIQLAKELEGVRQELTSSATPAEGVLCGGDQGAGATAGANCSRVCDRGKSGRCASRRH